MTDSATDRWKGQGAVFCCAVLWSTSGLFIKLVSWHPVVIAGSRSFIAALFMLAVRIFIVPKGRARSKPGPFWAAGAAYAFTMLSFVVANKLTASANAILLQYSAPVWAALLGWVLIREKPHWEHWGALVFVIAGLVLFFKEGLVSGSLLGDCVAVSSGILFAAHSVFLRMQKDGNPMDAMLLAHVITFIISIPFFFLYPPEYTVSSVLPVVFMGTIQIGCASILFSYGIRRISAIQAMLTAMIEPVLNPVWVLAITGEKPSVSALAGGLIIIVAVAVSSVIGKRREALQNCP
ncbi:MAG: DMT family transporter [Treponema sp.]|jgi:drug/metabolite transporter (DMT)-like permease|nr:DMT family transporter [Treponema sp.]